MTNSKRYDPTKSERYGLNEVEDAIDELEVGDHIRLHVTFMTEAAGEMRARFEADVTEIPEEKGSRAELDTPGRMSSGSPPVQADWYIGESATALRKDSHIAYSINTMEVWPAENLSTTDDITPHWFEASVVDGEIPMEYHYEHSETVSIFADSEAQARLAVRLVYGDTYEVIEFLGGHQLEDDIDVEDPVEFVETNLVDYDSQINAYEVFDDAGFRVSYREDGERVSKETTNLEHARQWFTEEADTDTSSPLYEGWTSVVGDSILQRLPARRVDEYLDD